MSRSTGRILPRPHALDPEADTSSDERSHLRRLAVEAARAQRCAALTAHLEALRSSFDTHPSRVLEIGCGHGHFLAAYARAHPMHFCLGIDYCAERVRRAGRKQERHPLGNLQFMRAEVWEFLDALPAGMRFDAFFVLFPDPWPKRRHRKYRLVSSRFLDRIAACASPAAALFLRTDAVAYIDEAREAIAAHTAWRLDPSAPWPFEQPSVFQAKAPSYQSLVAINASPAR